MLTSGNVDGKFLDYIRKRPVPKRPVPKCPALPTKTSGRWQEYTDGTVWLPNLMSATKKSGRNSHATYRFSYAEPDILVPVVLTPHIFVIYPRWPI